MRPSGSRKRKSACPAGPAPICARPASASPSPMKGRSLTGGVSAAGIPACLRCSRWKPAGTIPAREKFKRMRNRISHKFSYYPQSYDGEYSCVGCGRCVVSCPISLDIRQVVKHAVEGAPEAVAEAAPVPAPKPAPARVKASSAASEPASPAGEPRRQLPGPKPRPKRPRSPKPGPGRAGKSKSGKKSR